MGVVIQMSIRATKWALDHSAAESPLEVAILVALADFADDDGASVFPSVETLARRARCSRRSAERALRALRDRGVIKPVGTSKLRTRLYRLDMPARPAPIRLAREAAS